MQILTDFCAFRLSYSMSTFLFQRLYKSLKSPIARKVTKTCITNGNVGIISKAVTRKELVGVLVLRRGIFSQLSI